MNRHFPERNDPLMEVSERGVDDPASICKDLNDNTIRATLRWFDSQTNASPRLLAWKLRNGGVYVPEDETAAAGTVWNADARLAWIEAFMPEEIAKDDGFTAEVALVGALRAGFQPSVGKVRRFMADVEADTEAANKQAAAVAKLRRTEQPDKAQPQRLGEAIEEAA